jgi:hypothetical protein
LGKSLRSLVEEEALGDGEGGGMEARCRATREARKSTH